MDDLATILSKDILRGSKRAFERGSNLFPTSSMLASAVLFFMGQEKRAEIKTQANQAIITSLGEQGAQAVIYAPVRNPGGRDEHESEDVVMVVARDGKRTYIEKFIPVDGRDGVVIRGYTSGVPDDALLELE